MADRGLYWPREKTLVVADLHWGKSEVFRFAGVPIPGGVLTSDLKRLSRLIESSGCETLLILGDLIHSFKGVTAEVSEEVMRWRFRHKISMSLVEGNHDKGVKSLLNHWDIKFISESLIDSPFEFSHAETQNLNFFNIHGHLHPVIFLRSHLDSVRLPCFYISQNSCTLPAFSLFTGGFEIVKGHQNQIFAIVDSDHILRI